MRKIATLLLCLFVINLIAEAADARIFGRRRRSRKYDSSGVGYDASLHAEHAIDEYTQGVAQYRANEMARMGTWGHFWAGFGNGYAEGVGSGMTPDAARSSCCDFGGRIIGQGLAQSASGQWFCCTIYGW